MCVNDTVAFSIHLGIRGVLTALELEFKNKPGAANKKTQYLN